MKKIVLSSLLAMAAASASAQGYIGASVGVARVNLDCPANVNCTRNDAGFKMYGGAHFTDKVAGEIAYVDFGQAKVNNTATSERRTVSAQALTLAVAARAAISTRLDAVGRVGLAFVSTEDKGTALATVDTDVVRPYFGLGLEFAFSKEFKGMVSGDLTQARARDGESGRLAMITVGAHFDF